MVLKYFLQQFIKQIYLFVRCVCVCSSVFGATITLAQPYINNWPTQGGFFYNFDGGKFNVLEGISKLTEGSKTTSLSDENGKLILYTDGVYLYDNKGKVLNQKLLPKVDRSDLSQIVPHPLKKDSYWLILNERYETNQTIDADDLFRIEVTKESNGSWKIGQTDTFPRLGIYYGQQTLFDAETNCYTTVAYDPNFVLFSFKYCGCGGFEVFTDTLSDSMAEFYSQSWFPQVLRFSNDQKKVFLEAPEFANIPEFIVTGDYDIKTGKVSNRKTLYKKDVWTELSDVRDAVFSTNNKYVYFIASGQSRVYQMNLESLEIIETNIIFNDLDMTFYGFLDMEMGADKNIYLWGSGRSKSVIDVWRIPNPDSNNAYIELVYRNTNFIKYPGPPKQNVILGILPDFSPFLYDENYKFPTPLHVPQPHLQLEGDGCYTSPTVVKNIATEVDSTTWQLWQDKQLLHRFTGNEVTLVGLSPGTYTVTATNYIQCVDGEAVPITFELDSLPTIGLSEDSLFFCPQNDKRQEVIVKHNTQQSSVWNTGQAGDKVVFKESGEFVATVNNNCGNASATLIQTSEQVEIPNIITPNGDGKNDSFVVKYIGELPLQLSIKNRWGGEVFQSADYQNNWSPTNLSSGVYYYELTTPKQCVYNSWLQIIK